jgi:hypothetical protein
MSGTTTVALAAVIVSGIGVVASLGFNFWNASSERTQRLKEREEDRREWYKRTLFEKRLLAVQAAYAWWRRMMEVTHPDPRNPDPDAESKAAEDAAIEARRWYDDNSIYLEGFVSHASDFVGMTNAVRGWVIGVRDESVGKALDDALQAIKNLGNRLLSSELSQAGDSKSTPP